MRSLACWFSVPWSGFVAVFVYGAVLTLVVIGQSDLPPVFMAAAYGLPVLGYAGLLANRAVHAVASIQIHVPASPRLLVGR